MRLHIQSSWRLAKTAVTSWVDDFGQSMGAALAYYTIFSLAPLLLIVISVAGLVFGPDAARGEILGELRGMMGEDAARAVQGLLESTNNPATGAVATLIGAVMLLIGATTVFAELQTSLDRIWRVPARIHTGIWALLRARLLSFGMILCIGFLLMVSLIFSAALNALENWWSPWFSGWVMLASFVNQVISFGLATAAFAMIYKVMPRARIEWPDVWVGAAVTAALFTVGKYLIGLYIGKSGVTSVFGAAGSLVVVLVWVYYSAQIFLIGAEFTWVYAHQLGSRRGRKLPGSRLHMTETSHSKVGPERIRIDMHADWEVSYWTRKLGISSQELAQAIQAVGNQAHEIVVYFRQRELQAEPATWATHSVGGQGSR